MCYFTMLTNKYINKEEVFYNWDTSAQKFKIRIMFVNTVIVIENYSKNIQDLHAYFVQSERYIESVSHVLIGGQITK